MAVTNIAKLDYETTRSCLAQKDLIGSLGYSLTMSSQVTVMVPTNADNVFLQPTLTRQKCWGEV